MYTVAITGMPEQQREEIPFSVGNPSVEHITGTLHLYRQDPSGADDVVRASYELPQYLTHGDTQRTPLQILSLSVCRDPSALARSVFWLFQRTWAMRTSSHSSAVTWQSCPRCGWFEERMYLRLYAWQCLISKTPALPRASSRTSMARRTPHWSQTSSAALCLLLQFIYDPTRHKPFLKLQPVTQSCPRALCAWRGWTLTYRVSSPRCFAALLCHDTIETFTCPYFHIHCEITAMSGLIDDLLSQRAMSSVYGTTPFRCTRFCHPAAVPTDVSEL